MSVDMSDFTEYDEGTFGYELERLRREGYALADEVEPHSSFAAALIRDDVRRWFEASQKQMDEIRDDFLRQHGWIP